MGNFKRKGVVFNIQDPDQVKLYEHAEKRSNFSAYIKRLIQRDMDLLKISLDSPNHHSNSN
jgi:hypothetical protein